MKIAWTDQYLAWSDQGQGHSVTSKSFLHLSKYKLFSFLLAIFIQILMFLPESDYIKSNEINEFIFDFVLLFPEKFVLLFS